MSTMMPCDTCIERSGGGMPEDDCTCPMPTCQTPRCGRNACYQYDEDPWRFCKECRDQAQEAERKARLEGDAAYLASLQNPPKGTWRWREPRELRLLGREDSVDELIDDEGNIVCDFGDSAQYYPTEGVPPSGEARELIRSAPEMADLLRRTSELVRWLAPFAFAFAAAHPESHLPKKVAVDDAYRASTNLLFRIDHGEPAKVSS